MKDSDSSLMMIYTIVYIFFAGCFIVPPTEFVSAGITIQNIFAQWLGSEGLHFIYFHIKRISLTLFVHSLIPLGYYIGLALFAPGLELFNVSELEIFWSIFLLCSVILPLFVIGLIFFWHREQGKNHPLVKQLAKLAGENDSWRTVASSINVEFRRIDKFTCGIPSRLVVVTDSWILKTSTYHVYVANQHDIHLTLASAEEHSISYQSQTTVQYLSINIGRIEPGLQPFSIRLNSLEFGDLKEKLHGQIRNVRNIVIHQSMSDLFLKEFKEIVDANPLYSLPQGMEVEQCIGCMQKTSDVKLQKWCELNRPVEGEGENSDNCVQCFCRPMWCLECMGKWFASRQDQHRPETWLASKSPCPTCRSKFCVLDVCKIV